MMDLCRSADLSWSSGVTHDTIRAFKADHTKSLTAMNETAIMDAVEENGVEVIPENGGAQATG